MALAIDDPSMLPTCENCSSEDICVTPGTDLVLCTDCSTAALEILAGWKGWPAKKPKRRLPRSTGPQNPKPIPTAASPITVTPKGFHLVHGPMVRPSLASEGTRHWQTT